MVKFLKHQVRAIKNHKIETCSEKVSLQVVQQPVKARVSGRKETRNSSRRLVDPQPIVQLKLEQDGRDIIDYSLGIYFIRATIDCCGFSDPDTFMAKQRKSRNQDENLDTLDVLRGTTTITAQFYKGSPYVACGVFDNLSVRFKGEYKLRFDLYEIQSFAGSNNTVQPKIIHWDNATVYSSKFTVYTDASFDGLEASPMLNEQLKKAGCRIRTRKPKTVSSFGQSPMDHKIGKPLKPFPNAMPYYPQATGYGYSSPAPYNNGSGYFDSPMASRAGTPSQRTESVYSRSNTPMNGYMGTPMSSQYFTPVQQTPQTPDTHQAEVFNTPMTHIPMNDNYSTGLDLSPLESDVIFNGQTQNGSNSGYVLSNNETQAFKLDFNNVSTLYQAMSSAPRSETVEDQQNINNGSGGDNNLDFMSLLEMQNQSYNSAQQQENPFAMNELEFSF